MAYVVPSLLAQVIWQTPHETSEREVKYMLNQFAQSIRPNDQQPQQELDSRTTPRKETHNAAKRRATTPVTSTSTSRTRRVRGFKLGRGEHDVK